MTDETRQHMASNEPNVDEFQPRLDRYDQYLESPESYFKRIQHLIPGLDCDVVDQWLYEHWQQHEQFRWLNFKQIYSTRETWTLTEILESGLQDHPVIQQYKDFYANGGYSPRLRRIATFFELNRTWPKAPIILENLSGKLTLPNYMALERPFHLLEGHHRFAVFSTYAERGQLAPNHDVWIIRG
ncbi:MULTISPECIES: hypothetical protein [Pseudomonas]|uniref:Uncharacterized protein n=2 Tax=Pseudomonas luteola TaxID=47886 RepID=A0ABS0MW46_PSELU|nr:MULTISPECIES: hypothetical protein [Pseudomonas]MBA1250204.1 hypothetical protein [Pseudomonas zeshuii]MBH3440955.1 hypothetical protein [Pseudomonas luteola]